MSDKDVDRIELKPGTTIKIDDMPFELVEHTDVFGRIENIKLTDLDESEYNIVKVIGGQE
jgi:hypothetical protein